jgi:hypothetical protein
MFDLNIRNSSGSIETVTINYNYIPIPFIILTKTAIFVNKNIFSDTVYLVWLSLQYPNLDHNRTNPGKTDEYFERFIA